MKRTIKLAITVICLCFLAVASQAATRYWAGSSGCNNGGGTGTWPASGAGVLWTATPDSCSGGAAWSSSYDAIFGGAAGTVTMSSAITANSIRVNTTDYHFTAASAIRILTLTTGNFYVDSGCTAYLDDTGNTAVRIRLTSATTSVNITGPGTLRMEGPTATATGNSIYTVTKLFITGGGTYITENVNSMPDRPAAFAADWLKVDNDSTIAFLYSDSANFTANGGVTIGGSGATGGQIQVDPTFTITLNGKVTSGTSATLTKLGTGILILGADNSGAGFLKGPIRVSGGYFRFGSGSAQGGAATGRVTVDAGATYYGYNTSSGVIDVSRPLTLNGKGVSGTAGSLRYSAAAASTWSGAITLGSTDVLILSANAAGTLNLTGGITGPDYDLTIGGTGATTVSTGAIDVGYGGFSKAHTGILTLNSQLTSGTVNLTGGMLLVNGSISSGSVTVQNSATLGGGGIIAGAVTVQSGGTLTPGNSMGPLTANGSVTLNAGSTTEMEVDRSSPSNDQVAGIATLAQGGTLSVVNKGANLEVNDSFTLFSATTYDGSLFAAISPANPNNDPDLAWDLPALKTTGMLKVHRVPSAVDTSTTRAKGVSCKFRLSELFPATDAIDGDSVVLQSFTGGSQGATIETNATHLIYTPANDNNDSFNYTVTDNRGGTRTKAITINVANYSTGTVTITNNGTGSTTITFYGIPNFQYVIQCSPDMSAWSDVVTNPAAANGLIQYTASPPYNPAFYRIRTE